MKYFYVAVILILVLMGDIDISVAENDGDWIYYSSIETGSSEVYRVHPDGTQLEQLTFDAEDDYFQAISPDGQWLIIQSIEGNDYFLYRIGLVTGQIEQLTFIDSRFESWSPDGQAFLYTVFDEGGEKLWRMDWHDLSTHLVLGVNHGSPRWSPDGQWIVFTLSENGNLYRIQPDGEGQQAITSFSNARTNMEGWSPDGEWTIFGNWDFAENYHLYRVRIDASGLTQLTYQEGLQYRIIWTPDGNWMIYHNSLKRPGTALRDLYRIAADGSRNEQLTSTRNDQFFGFLPNGKWLYWASGTNINYGNLYEFDPETKVSKPITTVEIDFPELSPDKQWIVFHTINETNKLYISKVDMSIQHILVSGERAYNFLFWQACNC